MTSIGVSDEEFWVDPIGVVKDAFLMIDVKS